MDEPTAMNETDKPVRMLLTGGGTGGHLFPAIAAAEAMCAKRPGSTIMFVGTRRKMDKTSLAGYGFEVKTIRSYGLKGKKITDVLKAILVLPISIFEAAMHIIVFKPDFVFGVGGYVTGPVIAAAKLLGKKTIIHEQNSIPGLANRKLGQIADKICLSIPASSTFFQAQKTVFTGNPVREPILAIAQENQRNTKKEMKTILVLGGSQGAHRVNELVVEALISHRDCFTSELKVIHQTGNDDFEIVKNQYNNSGITSVVQPFFQDMASVYEQADVLVSRAGATTLAEVAVLGIPALLIPFPFAADDHQDKNADHYVQGGGCLKFKEKELTGKILAEQIEIMLSNDEKRMKMAQNMINLGHPLAAQKIVEVCLRECFGDSSNPE